MWSLVGLEGGILVTNLTDLSGLETERFCTEDARRYPSILAMLAVDYTPVLISSRIMKRTRQGHLRPTNRSW